jgi:eukaryotic-like serine/threonine-protein kinase
LEKDRDLRYQVASELRGDLKRLKREIDSSRSSSISVATPSGSTPIAATPVDLPPSGPSAVVPASAVESVSAVSGPASSAATVVSAQPSRKIWYIVAGALVAAIAVGGFFYTRTAHGLTEKDSILLTDFVNTTGDPVFDGTLKQALAVQLEQSPYLNVFPQERVRDTLKFMGRSPDERLTPDLARDVCQREGIKAVMNGTISNIGTQYVVDVNAVNCLTGDSLAHEQISADKKEQVLGAVGKAASSLRRKLGESLASIQKFDAPIEEVTTSSLEALKASSLGEAERDKGDEFGSIPFYKRAIDLDPNFAVAYARLGQVYQNSGQEQLAVENTKQAFERRDRTSELEKLYITTHYYDIVTGELDKSVESYELWRRTYPRDSIPNNNLSVFYGQIGKHQESLERALETMRLDPNAALSHQVLARAYLGLGRIAESKAIRAKQIDLKLDGTADHRALYGIAFLEGDDPGMHRQLDWAKGRPDEFLLLESSAEAAAFSGQMEKSRELYRQAIESAQRGKFVESVAGITARSAIGEARVGNTDQAGRQALAALAMDRSRETLPFAGIALAAGDVTQANAVADELSKRFPLDTFVNNIWLPLISAEIEFGRGSPAKAVDLLQPATPYELGWEARLLPIYTRGQAYLKAKQGREAAAEFQKLLDHRQICFTSAICSLAHLQLGRARVLTGDKAGARTAYQDFFALWKDADPDVPILKEAKSEYAKLQ